MQGYAHLLVGTPDADALADQKAARAARLGQQRAYHFDIADPLHRQASDGPVFTAPVRLPRRRLARQYFDQAVLLIKKQHAVHKGQVPFQLEQRVDVADQPRLINYEFRHVGVIGQRRELVEAIIQKGGQAVGRRQCLGIQPLAGEAVEQVLGQLLIKNRQGNQRHAHDHNGQQRIARHQATVWPGKPLQQHMEGRVGIHGVLDCFCNGPSIGIDPWACP